MDVDARGEMPRKEPAIRLHRGHRVPVRRQLATQLAAAIREGGYGPGGPLPSVRALAAASGVHRNTVRAAYRDLARRGLVTPRPGSGVYVRSLAPPAPPPHGAGTGPPPAVAGGDASPFEEGAARYAPGAGFRAFLSAERRAGRTTGDAVALCRRWERAVRAPVVGLVAPPGADRALWGAELRRGLPGVAVRETAAEELRDGPAGRAVAWCAALVSPSLWDEASGLLPPWVEVLALPFSAARRERRLLARLPEGALVGVVTVSDALHRRIRELAAGLRGEGIVLSRSSPERPARLERVCRVARIVLVDVTCLDRVEAVSRDRGGTARLVTTRALSPASVAGLARWFGLESLHRRRPEGNGR